MDSPLRQSNAMKYVEANLPADLAANYERFMHQTCVGLVELYAKRHQGRIPLDREGFIEEIVEGFLSITSRNIGGQTTESWLREREELAAYLRDAIEVVELHEKTKWRN
jgi:hypothetical protein